MSTASFLTFATLLVLMTLSWSQPGKAAPNADDGHPKRAASQIIRTEKMFQSTVWALCLIWMTNAIGAHAGGKTPANTHPCDIKNGGCSQICGRVGNKAICSCKVDYMLMNDKKSCKKHIIRTDEHENQYRKDLRCGTSYPIMEGKYKGRPAQCNPVGQSPCCSTRGWCGATWNHCLCPGCIHYKSTNAKVFLVGDLPENGTLYRKDLRCGKSFPIKGIPAQCNPDGQYHCCSTGGRCGKTKDHCLCNGCIDYKIIKDTRLKCYDGIDCIFAPGEKPNEKCYTIQDDNCLSCAQVTSRANQNQRYYQCHPEKMEDNICGHVKDMVYEGLEYTRKIKEGIMCFCNSDNCGPDCYCRNGGTTQDPTCPKKRKACDDKWGSYRYRTACYRNNGC